MSNRTRGTKGASSSMASAVKDPRVDGVLGALEKIGNLMGTQAQERAAAVALAAEALVAAANPVNGNNGLNGNGHGGGNGNMNRPMSQPVEHFLKLKPARFDDAGDPEMAPRWIEKLEKAFEVLGCTEAKKVTLAVYQPEGTADDWWKVTGGGIFPEGTAPNWTAFTEAFNGKYFSETAQERKPIEFQRLRENQPTIDRYEAEFSRLSRYAPRMVENMIDKARRFRDGLRPDLRSQMIAPNLRTYNEMYERGQMIERDMKERAATSGSRFAPIRDNRRLGKRPMMSNKRFIPPNRKNIGKPVHQSNWNRRLCGRKHGNGPCPSRTGACFKCGQLGYQVRTCPSQAPRPLFQGQ
ncbi:uncharacterized protein LOC115730698 [Rhodamnia argentea]|uniref:Uncharacterized protein LOC115730698 n=1 Tax=Rhodamnia argentea TaxID=178133 RepID=A0A8B8N437_9MYRT|nr:uncharacterized protein LOC115730698 [Rhodamnia argentea]